MAKGNCSKCKKKLDSSNNRYCKKCKAKYMREWRKTHPMSIEARFKSNVRSKTSMRIRRGLLKKLPCIKCGKVKAEAHHEDYSKPYDVIWLCRFHHLEHHKLKLIQV